VRVTRADLRSTLELRSAMQGMLRANNRGSNDPHAPAVLDAAARRAGLRVRFDARGAHLAPAAGGVSGALGRLLAMAAGLMADGSWARLKACRADACRWAFFDGSRNRSRAWCSMAVCGNRAKVQAFRRRRAPTLNRD
jgi:predicted RNA-binding Zn ribbon-like protein